MSVLPDFCFAIRSLRRNLGVTTAAVLVLAAGIGLTTAVFSAVYAVLLKPLQYADPGRLVVALHEGRYPVSPADFLDYKAHSSVFSEIGAAQGWGGALQFGYRAELIPGLQITANIIPMLGVQPMLGRAFSPAEETPGQNRVLILGHKLWTTHFSSDPHILGRTIPVGDTPYTIIGVMPPQFQFAPFWQTEAQMWTPLVLAPRVNDRGGRSLRVFARLRPGVSVDQAQSQMSTIAARLAAAFPVTNADLGIQVMTLHEKVAGPMRPTLLILLGTVAFVLIIACADTGNLLLARAAARRKEIATKLALGATRFQLGSQLAMESLLVAGLGGTLGILLAYFALNLLRATLPASGLPRQEEIALNPAVLIFAAGLSMIAGFAAGMIPAIQSSSPDVSEDLKDSGRGSSGERGMRRTQRVLIAAQVSMALVLLVCAGLLLRSLHNLNSVDAGFNPTQVITFEAHPSDSRFDTPAKRAALFQQMESALAATPGVESVSAINHLPIGGDIWRLGYELPDRAAPPPGHGFAAVYRVVRPGYFRTMRIPLVRGRDVNAHDNENAPFVVVINETMAHRQWPDADPLGRQIVFRDPDSPSRALTIIGIAKDVRQSDWTGPVDDEIYLPYMQRSGAAGLKALTFVVRASSSIEAVVRKFDVPISQFRTMDEVIAAKLWRSRVSTQLLSVFAAIALALAGAGIYGVISYSVRRRSQELGIRTALGATPMNIRLLILRDSLSPVLLGIVVGSGCALAAARLLSTLLYGVAAADPITFAVVTLILLAMAVFAGAISSQRNFSSGYRL